jgi:hypothetical protein
LIPTCPTLTKVLLRSTRILIYIDGLLSVAPNCAKPLLSYLLPFSRTFNCTSKTTGWFTELKLIRTCPTLTKVLLQGSTRILIYIDGLFVAPNCGCRCYLTFFHFPERSIALVKRLAGHQKELKLIPTCPTLKSVTQGSTRILIYIDGLLSVAPNCAQACYLTFFHFP